MDLSHGRTARVATQTRSHELTSVLEASLPRIQESIEQVGLYLLLAAFWGLIIFLALIATLS